VNPNPEQFPRVEIPGADREQVEALREILDAAEAHRKHLRTQQRGISVAMMLLGKPIFRGVKRKPKRPTKHVRHMRAIAARSTKTA
jgi:hypothetical protein